MSISSDEVNYLIYRYLQENGYAHSAFSFAYESLVPKSSVAYTDVPPGALIAFLQKGLEYVSIEEHIQEVRSSFKVVDILSLYHILINHLFLIIIFNMTTGWNDQGFRGQ